MSTGFVKRFGQELRSFRGAANISQERLAELCGLHRTYIGAVERGERNISLRNIKRLADALDIKVSKLFENL